MSIYTSRTFSETKTEPELLILLDDPHPLVRCAAIDELVKYGNKSIVPKLLEKAEHDPFMVVRRAAFRALRVLTGEKFEAMDIDAWKAWWAKKKDTWPKR